MSNPSRTRHLWAVVGLVPMTIVWGGSFAAMKVALQAGLSVGAMLSLRFTLGAFLLGILLLAFRVPIRKRDLLDGCYLGLVLATIFWLQADGLRFTTTSKSGFITGLYVIFTPMVSLLVRDRLKISHGLGALVAAMGLFLLVHEPGVPMGGWNRGDSETLFCAIACGFHIVMIAHFSRRSHGFVLAFVQVAVVAVLSWILNSLVPSHPLADGSRLSGFQGAMSILAQPRVWISLIYQGALATGLAFYLMSTLQAYLGATEAAIIYSLEPVFTALLAVSGFIPGIKEVLTPLQMAGGAVILGAMLLAEVGPRLLRSDRTAPEEAIG